MNRMRGFLFLLPVILVACSSVDRETIARLRDVRIEIKEEKVEGGLEKAMEGYRAFLEESPDSALAPEAMRRLADLKVEREYGLLTDGAGSADAADPPSPPLGQDREGGNGAGKAATYIDPPPPLQSVEGKKSTPSPGPVRVQDESEAEFESRATQSRQMAGTTEDADGTPDGADDLERAGALEAIELYRNLLKKYPLYKRNDQVLYQMSRAYEELGRPREAMKVMDRLTREFPGSRYLDEVQFRRAEHFFTHKRYLDAEEAYTSIVNLGIASSYYDLALYKLGWTFYKQELYEEALHRFIALLDYKVSVGYDFDQTEDEIERKRLEDAFRVISLSFSYLGGADSVVDYFSRHGKRRYEDGIYSNLGEYYFDKRRYSDAAETYGAFVSRNPFHRVSPHFHMRIIEIHMAGAFPSLVIESKKTFAKTYSLKAEYWRHFEPGARPEVLGYLKTNLTDLANHYHALYQDPEKPKEKTANYREALHWYREFLASFPAEAESPSVNHRLADLLLENRSFAEAAAEYEKTAYGYPPHGKSSAAGYAAVYALRENLKVIGTREKEREKRDVVRVSLKFAESFPEHEKAAIVLGAAADDLYAMEDYERALAAGSRLIEAFPEAEKEVRRGGWLVVAHASYELLRYAEAEKAYMKVLDLMPAEDDERDAQVDNLAASIYKQGEMANLFEDHRSAADHFLRVSRLAPTSGIRPTAEFDAAAALILLEAWEEAATVLTGFRSTFPGHDLQPEVTKKIAYVYKESGRFSRAADEYERIERESGDEEVRREALLLAAELHEEVKNSARALAAYRRYVENFPRPVEPNLETRGKIAEILKARNDRENYLDELREMVAVDASAGSGRTSRTRFLAAQATLVLGEWSYDRFVEVRLIQPFEVNLDRKRDLMKAASQEFSRLLEYEIGEFTAAATYYLAEIYAHFSKALMESERPEGLSPLEREQYELAIEEQAWPFEEKAIDVHEKNLELISVDIYNEWVDKSLKKLAKIVPARYARPEESSKIVRTLFTFTFEVPPHEAPEPGIKESSPAPAALSAGSDPGSDPEEVEEPVEPNPADESQQTEKSIRTENDPLIDAPVQVEKPIRVERIYQGEGSVPGKGNMPFGEGEETENLIHAEETGQGGRRIEEKPPEEPVQAGDSAQPATNRTASGDDGEDEEDG